MKAFKLYDSDLKHVASYRFYKQKSAYFVKFNTDYLHDNVWVDDIEKFKRDKNFRTGYEIGMTKDCYAET